MGHSEEVLLKHLSFEQRAGERWDLVMGERGSAWRGRAVSLAALIGGLLCCRGGLPGGSAVMSPPANARDAGLILGSRRSPGEGNGNSPQYSCLQNPLDREAWWAPGHGVAELDTT